MEGSLTGPGQAQVIMLAFGSAENVAPGYSHY